MTKQRFVMLAQRLRDAIDWYIKFSFPDDPPMELDNLFVSYIDLLLDNNSDKFDIFSNLLYDRETTTETIEKFYDEEVLNNG